VKNKVLLYFSKPLAEITEKPTFAVPNEEKPQKHRGVAERSNAAVLKTVVPQGTGGSNPSSSA
jgi:hypothetical protein